MGRIGLSKIVSLLIALLAASNLSIYLLMSSENQRLRNELTYVRSRLYENEERLKWLENEVRTLNDSYRRVLDSNRRLDDALRYLQGKLILPYNFTLMSIDEFYDRFTFKYTGEMVEFVSNATGWWDGSEEDFLSDLYKIYRSWRDYYIVDKNFTMPQEWLPYINIGGWNYDRTRIELGGWGRDITYIEDTYLKEVLFYEDNPIMVPIDYVARHFRYHRGLCFSYAFVLVTLYYIYSDVTGRHISAAYLSIDIHAIDSTLSHGCVLLKNTDGLIAIVDWEAITAEDCMIKFLPLDTVRTLHSRYWFGYQIDYIGVWMRPNTGRRFSSYEEFQEWLMKEF
ncbi:MAG: hypothetical protein RMJ00_04185 [Nitrososphaerota archaeon]|nr:hypothetical protein [Nitrososphaerota archaeon]